MLATDLARRLPAYTRAILTAFNAAGFEAYLVGGAVRDLLLGLTPEDFDITTSARPEQVLQICKKQSWSTLDKLGHNFGCVIILLDGVPTEVTTFRGERYDSSDAHRPAATWYCDALQEDLSRRDFTVNAMAVDIDGTLYDYFGGQQDLAAKLLRTVGDPERRYREDALRMLRACRFTAQLGFTYVQSGGDCGPCGMEGTPYYLPRSYRFPVERCQGLSLERVRRELEKLLLSRYAGRGLMLMMATGLLGASCRVRQNQKDVDVPILPEALHLLGLRQNPRFHLYDTWEHTLLAIDNSPRQLAIRWALVLHDLGKGLPQIRTTNKEGQPSDPGHEAQSAAMAQEILTRLRYPAAFVRLVVWLVAQHMRFAPMLLTGEKTLLRWVRGEATGGVFKSSAQLTEAYSLLAEVFLADMGATHARENPQLMAEGRALGEQVIELARTRMPVAPGDLAVGGRDLLALLPQAQLKNTFSYLLERVQSGNLPNDRDALLAAVRKNIKRRQSAAMI
ncbi:MAG: HD domain-containing protein [Phascolarctobacterium sp.]|uniref:CCA tRNA nucleotidyltransferase n=1 Tax=Phascolarctobacterium sp. TaxID=2049039 RepID=UPI0026DB5B5F|nr:HD domain-containing protein [Phascolarctobacterium sp.]MDO4921468.1 HD domain-containing protein [Phascolarctobacterium sp.]